jgi:hypothetical protein
MRRGLGSGSITVIRFKTCLTCLHDIPSKKYKRKPSTCQQHPLYRKSKTFSPCRSHILAYTRENNINSYNQYITILSTELECNLPSAYFYLHRNLYQKRGYTKRLITFLLTICYCINWLTQPLILVILDICWYMSRPHLKRNMLSFLNKKVQLIIISALLWFIIWTI